MLNHLITDLVFDALGDSTRRAIVDRLSSGPASVSEIAEPLEISRSAVLQHLQLLEQSRLVSSEKTGRIRVCRLDPEGFKAAESWLDKHRRQWERRLDRLGEILEGERRKS